MELAGHIAVVYVMRTALPTMCLPSKLPIGLAQNDRNYLEGHDWQHQSTCLGVHVRLSHIHDNAARMPMSIQMPEEGCTRT